MWKGEEVVRVGCLGLVRGVRGFEWAVSLLRCELCLFDGSLESGVWCCWGWLDQDRRAWKYEEDRFGLMLRGFSMVGSKVGRGALQNITYGGSKVRLLN